MEKKFVISIKRIKSYGTNETLPDNEQYWEYAAYDRYAGSFSTGYPCFGFEWHAESFQSVEEAEKWWNANEEYMFDGYNKKSCYDISTLAIRERIYRPSKKLSTNI